MKLASRNIIGSTSTFLSKKEILDRIHDFDSKFPVYQDWELYLRACAVGAQIKGSSCGLVKVRIHSGVERISNDHNKILQARKMMKVRRSTYDVGSLPATYLYDWAELEMRYGVFGEGRAMLLNAVRKGYISGKSIARCLLAYSGESIYRWADMKKISP